MTPNQQSLRYLREQGFLADVVEQRIPHAKFSRDLFNILDIVAVGNGQTMGVQATSVDHISHRRVKMRASTELQTLLDAGWVIVIHGWRKDGRLKEEVLT